MSDLTKRPLCLLNRRETALITHVYAMHEALVDLTRELSTQSESTKGLDLAPRSLAALQLALEVLKSIDESTTDGGAR